ncbi:L-threonylcarbamoyladenylate synthase [Dubosiella newyorkensis]|uniref:L-threonylcarbamoyladenylate synthase n=1 Tax=Dubosiella newyorkensis TaxID=1862672 RepID=UPI0032B24A07
MKKLTWDDTEEIVEGLNQHKIYAFPTDTVYGVGVAYGDLNDLTSLKHTKHRPEEKPIPMMVSNLEQIESVAQIDPLTKWLIKEWMPGAFTIVLPLKQNVSKEYTNGKDTIAIRMPDSAKLLGLIERLGRPMMVSSANQSGEASALTYEEAAQALPMIEGVVDGQCLGGVASTIVSCSNGIPVVLREGPIRKEEIIQSCRRGGFEW